MKDIMTYNGFIGSVHFSSEDRVFFGKIEGINDLVTFEGTTVDELEESFHYMVDEHIKDCKESKLPVEKSYKGSLNIRMPSELHRKASYQATLLGISLNEFIKKAIENETKGFNLNR